MNIIEEEQLKMEIAHIFESGANEIRIFEMVKSFIDSRKLASNTEIIGNVSGIAQDFKPLKELVEGEMVGYEHFPPNDYISEVHKEACEEALKKVEKYYR